MSDLSPLQTAMYTEFYTDWLKGFDQTITHLINMDIETTGIVSKEVVTKLIDLQLAIQSAGYKAPVNGN